MQQLHRASRFNRRAIKVEQATKLVLESVAPGQQEMVPLWKAGGRRLAESLCATSDWPPFARSGMDGYAVRSEDTLQASPDSPVKLRVLNPVTAGGIAAGGVELGSAIRIMTGGVVPCGADAVVMLEQTTDVLLDGLAAVQVKQAALPGQHIAQPGEEFRLGSLLAQSGTLIRPGHAALLGTFGYARVPVFTKPRIAVIATGSELIPVTAQLGAGLIRDSNSGMVAAMIEQSGGIPLQLGCKVDQVEAIVAALVEALDQADIVITTGGVSVGDHDVMAAVMRSIRNHDHDQSEIEASAKPKTVGDHSTVSLPSENLHSSVKEMADPFQSNYEHSTKVLQASLDPSTRLLFDKVAMRPGSPTSAALVNGKLLVALSGNPGACFVGLELFVRPVLLRLQGVSMEEAMPRTVTAILDADWDKGSPHERFVRTRLYTADSILHADPLAFNKSSMLASIPDADGLIRIPAGPRGAAKGEIVEVLLL
ncbi:hypothetical protein Back11_60620 [Paenibacillus baekrokdamisoli]|uniref:Molybdopterin molybdenumtransferase n=1 Tax=Paenibacillus baekrokdamisoli TaxID=1712516 RepID=A0A3G9J0J8_9BACL|nr:molybdopterin molybdotransferase MoeA [Paenibacillus baekrokdamisoli]MBB3072133.1 molybdopterin molybdotransferase [Paenibacillus baekrokdamisoli]BBH24717.1 hypothetical protein Back11_60620 [Paenibacillus baekrokdamisoli]